MKFVKGVPFKGAKKKDASWYLLINGELPCINMATNIFNARLEKIIKDPHHKIGNAFTTLAIEAVIRTQLALHTGARNGYFMNRVGGMCPSLHNIQETTEAEQWPDAKRIDVSRWPRGTHWYAKVDGRDVQDENGNIKWRTAKEAERQAKIFREKMDKTY